MKYLKFIVLFLTAVLLSGFGGWYLGVVTTEVTLESAISTEVPYPYNQYDFLQRQYNETMAAYQRIISLKEIEYDNLYSLYLYEEQKYKLPREVEKIIYQQVPINFREWQSLDEFYGVMDGVSITYFKSNACMLIEYLCLSLLSQGYPVYPAFTLNGYYYGVRVVSTDYGGIDRGHAGLLVDIQGSWYYYDPETKEIVRLF